MAFHDTTLSAEIVDRAQAMTARLGRIEFYDRLLAGTLDRDGYAAWLVQMHKYVRYSETVARGLADAMAGRDPADPIAASLREYAEWEYMEEAAHDDLILKDLSVLWGTSVREAFGRVESTAKAPSIAAWEAGLDLLLQSYPEAVAGVALALETVAAGICDRIHANMLATGSVSEAPDALRFVHAHRAEVEDEHRSHAACQVDLVEDPAVRGAIFAFACGALTLFEGLGFFLDEVQREPLLAA